MTRVSSMVMCESASLPLQHPRLGERIAAAAGGAFFGYLGSGYVGLAHAADGDPDVVAQAAAEVDAAATTGGPGAHLLVDATSDLGVGHGAGAAHEHFSMAVVAAVDDDGHGRCLSTGGVPRGVLLGEG